MESNCCLQKKTKQEKEDSVTEEIAKVQVNDCKDTFIGNDGEKNILIIWIFV